MPCLYTGTRTRYIEFSNFPCAPPPKLGEFDFRTIGVVVQYFRRFTYCVQWSAPNHQRHHQLHHRARSAVRNRSHNLSSTRSRRSWRRPRRVSGSLSCSPTPTRAGPGPGQAAAGERRSSRRRCRCRAGRSCRHTRSALRPLRGSRTARPST